MKFIFVTGIVFYQAILSPLIKGLLGVSAFCRYSPSCSAYARAQIEHFGVVRGSLKAGKRILSCQPFTTKAL